MTSLNHRTPMIVGGALAGALSLGGSLAAAELPCPPDIDCSGAVNVDDLVTVITEWGATGSPADVDGSGLVEVGDLVAVVLAWGPCHFDYGPAYEDGEALQIALEMLGPAGPLVVAPASYERAERDLDLIRAAFPDLAGQAHTMAWAPNQLIVQVIQGAPQDQYGCLNAFYDVIDEDLLFSSGGTDWYVITFSAPSNVEALAGLYEALPEIQLAEPNGLIGGENFWSPSIQVGGVWRWDIDDGWWDCFDGCDCHEFYVIETTEAGRVELISFQQFGQPWCDFDE